MFVDPEGSAWLSFLSPIVGPLIIFTKGICHLLEKIVEETIVLPIAQTIYGEAGGRFEYDDWQDGMIAVATIISNRKKHDDFPDAFVSVCTEPNQFGGYARGKNIYKNKSYDEIMWNYAISIAWDMVRNGSVMQPALNSEYVFFHSTKYGDPERINNMKRKPETLIYGGNMFFINY